MMLCRAKECGLTNGLLVLWLVVVPTGIAVWLNPHLAAACSLPRPSGDVMVPVGGAIVQPRPLLLAYHPTAELYTADLQKQIAIQPAQDSRYAQLFSAQGEKVFAFEPVEPLAAGRYDFDGREFTVSDAAELPATIAMDGVELNLYVGAFRASSGGATSSCAGIRTPVLDIRLMNMTDPSVPILVRTRRGSSEATTLVHAAAHSEHAMSLLVLLNGIGPIQFDESSFELELFPVTAGGIPGPSLLSTQLDPGDYSDPRVHHREVSGDGSGSGCSLTAASQGGAVVWVLALLWLFVRYRQRLA